MIGRHLGADLIHQRAQAHEVVVSAGDHSQLAPIVRAQAPLADEMPHLAVSAQILELFVKDAERCPRRLHLLVRGRDRRRSSASCSALSCASRSARRCRRGDGSRPRPCRCAGCVARRAITG